MERNSEEKQQIRDLLDNRDTTLPFTVNALQVVSKRYLIRNLEGKLQENPEEMFARVARGLADVELQYGATSESTMALSANFYSCMASFEFTPAGRTLSNVNAPTRLVSNCIVLHIEDSMESIFGTLSDAALLQKAGSGLGFPLHLMRPAGFVTKASFGQASGPVSFLHVYNTAFGVIKQQNRHGANMAVMSVDHPDIIEFLHCKDHEGDLRNFNVSVGLTHEFMTKVRSNDPNPWMCNFKGQKFLPRRISRDANFTLTDIQEIKITPRSLFMEIVDSAWKTGEPGCVFLDTVNNSNPVPGLGRIEACNPCGEQFLHDGDVCNLGSINLEKFVKDKKVDFERLRVVTELATQMLDNVIDISDFPVERVNYTFRANRRIGLGIMGFADMLYQLGIGYNTPAGRKVAEDVMLCIQESARNKSSQLASYKGNFPNWEKSIWKDKNIPMRNAAITNVAPTGTISMMFDVSGGVEPYFALAYYYKGILGGNVQLSYVNKHLKQALVDCGIYSEALMDDIINKGSVQKADVPQHIKDIYVTSMDISADDHILMQAAFQKSCDNAISKTINFPNSATHQEILRGYLMAWENNCKGCTVYRDGSRVLQVLNLNKDEESSDQLVVEDSQSQTTDVILQDALVVAKQALVSTQKRGKEHAEESVDQDLVLGKKRRVYPAILSCPDCDGELLRQEGCNMCRACGFSACSR